MVTWTYDRLNRLNNERRSGANAYSITHNYDPAGNRVQRTDGATITTYVYDFASQLVTQQDGVGRTTYGFDNDGNQSREVTPTGTVTSYTWDYHDRLTAIALPTAMRNTFQYDPDGRRTSAQDSSGTRRFIWDANNVLLEQDSIGVTQAIYTQDLGSYGNVLSQLRGAVSRFYHFDGLGSTDRLTDISGNPTDFYVYNAYGAIRASISPSVNPFRYVGRSGYYYDADLQNYYLRARHYSPGIGRFLSRDPFFELVRLDDTNPYWYCNDNPVNGIDPTGAEAITLTLGGGIVVTVIVIGIVIVAIIAAVVLTVALLQEIARDVQDILRRRRGRRWRCRISPRGCCPPQCQAQFEGWADTRPAAMAIAFAACVAAGCNTPPCSCGHGGVGACVLLVG